MFLSNTLSGNLALSDAGVIALLGYGVVFFGLILLMLVVMTLGKAFIAKTSAPKAAVPQQSAEPAAPVTEDSAPGSAGQLKLHDVPPKTAAMLMAIVANKLGKPLNELRFKSIKEVK